MMEMDFVSMFCGFYESMFLALGQEDSHVRYLYSLPRRDCRGSFSANIFWGCAELIIFLSPKKLKLSMRKFSFVLHFR